MTLENLLNLFSLGFLISEMKDLEKIISEAPVSSKILRDLILSLLMVSLASMQSQHTSHSYSFKTCSVNITPFLRTLHFIQRKSQWPIRPYMICASPCHTFVAYLLFSASLTLLQPSRTLLFLDHLSLASLFLGLLH